MDTLVDLIIRVTPVLTAVIAGLWALYTYINHLDEARRAAALQAQADARTRQIASQKPFLEVQLKLYFETSQVVGHLVAID
ncbi:MAG TPA: hypothetical protein VEC75_00700, partial [Stellaceae bacterium]|nr:hypothetical protein [Stellaceae bacterium]